MVFKCCVKTCNSLNTNCKMHRFPNDIEMVRKWLTLIHREDLLSKSLLALRNNYRVCDIHFSEDFKFLEYHNRTNLKVGAYPQLFLGTEEPSYPSVDVLETSSEPPIQNLKVL